MPQKKSKVSKDTPVDLALKTKLDDLFKIETDEDLNTLLTNAINTYSHIARLSGTGMAFYFGKPGSAELHLLRFPFEDIEEIKDPSIKLN